MPSDREKFKQMLPSDDEVDRFLQEAMAQEAASSASPSRGSALPEQDVRPNSIIKGRVLAVGPDRVTMDIGYKAEGIIDASEFGEAPPEIGAELEALVLEMEDDNGEVSLSVEEARRKRIFEDLDRPGAPESLTGTVRQAVKGGLVVDVGVRAFLPAREVDVRYVEDLEQWVGKRVTVRVIEKDLEKQRVVVSRRVVLQERRDVQAKELFERLAKGQVLEGEVSNLTDFGAFVDLGGTDGLIFKSDLAWGEVAHPSEVVQVGQTVKVVVLDFDATKGKISLGLKQAAHDPWSDATVRYAEGTRHKGRVKSMLQFGAVVEVEPGIEGLVHVSEMSWTKHVRTPAEVVAIGDEVEVEVVSVDLDRRRIGFSMKKVEANPWDNLEQRYPFATVVEGTVVRLVDFGAFVELDDGVEGLLHVSELSWEKRPEHPREVVEPGQRVTAIVIGADEGRRRLSLSLRKLQPDPWWDAEEDFAVGKKVAGTVKEFRPFGAFVELRPGVSGLLHVTHLGGPGTRPQDRLKLGEEIEVEVLEVDEEERRIGLKLVEF